jgi:predicted Na+-dependent transporter
MMGTPQSLVFLFSLASLFCLGLNFTADDLKLLLRDKRALGRALLANAVLLPFLMWMLLTTASVALAQVPGQFSQFATLGSGQQYVLLLLALASGSLLAPALANVALARVPYTYGMSAIMTLVSVVVVPLGLFVLRLNAGEQPGLAPTAIGTVLLYLVGFQLAPFLVGMAVRARYTAIAVAVRPFMSMLANIVFLLIIVGVLAQNVLPANTSELTQNGLLASASGLLGYVPILVGGLVLAAAALLIGYFMAGADLGMARGLGIATGLRNVTAVLVVVYSGALQAQLGEENTQAAAWVLIAYLVGLAAVTIAAGEWGRKPITVEAPAGAQPVTTVSIPASTPLT